MEKGCPFQCPVFVKAPAGKGGRRSQSEGCLFFISMKKLFFMFQRIFSYYPPLSSHFLQLIVQPSLQEFL